MFTGIIEATGTVTRLQQIASEWRLTIDSGKLDLADVKLGDSIAVNGCCLTVVEKLSNGFSADVSNATLECTTLGKFKSGTRVNLEKAMRASDRFGGHIVSGHVDGVGSLLESSADAQSVRLRFGVPAQLARYIAAKGSICVDGTSLTVNEIGTNSFAVNVIPHTQQETVIGDYQIGCRVNIEVDLIARYLERMLRAGAETGEETGEQAGGISAALLAEHGFK